MDEDFGMLENPMGNAFRNPLDDAFARMGLPSRNRKRYISEEEKDSILSKIGASTMSGIGAVGSGLDFGGAIVRNLIAGKPLKPIFMEPLSQEGRVSGREQLTEWGITPPNNEEWSWEDLPYDVAGLGYEIVTDPLTYLTAGMSAVGKAGKAAKAAGAMPDLISLAAKQGIGKRALRVGSKLQDFTHNSAGKLTPFGEKFMGKLTHAAKMGGDDIIDLLDSPIGSYMQFMGVPIGTGETALKIAKMADSGANAVRYSPPVRVLAAAFDYTKGGAMGTFGKPTSAMEGFKIQDAMTNMTRAKEIGAAEARMDLYDSVVKSYRGGWFDPHEYARRTGVDIKDANRETSNLGISLTNYIERGERLGDAWWNTRHGQRLAALPESQRNEMLAMADHVKEVIKNDPLREVEHGIDSRYLDDFYMDYSTRQIHRFPGDKSPRVGARAFSFTHPVLRTREFRDMPGGTAVLQEMSIDPQISGIANKAGYTKSDLTQATEYIKQMYGDEIVPTVEDLTEAMTARIAGTDPHPLDYMLPKTNEGWVDPAVIRQRQLDKRASELAAKMASLDTRHAENGIPFLKVNPADTGLWRHEASAQLTAAADGLHNFLGAEAQLAGTLSESGKNLYDLLHDIPGLEQDDAAIAFFKNMEKTDPEKFSQIMQATRDSMSDQMLMQAGDTPPYRLMAQNTDVPAWAAKESERFVKAFSSPQEAEVIANAFDKALKIWKRSVTIPWPAFHTRNFISGLVRNVSGGHWDVQSMEDAYKIMFGKGPIRGAAKRYGMEGMTDAQATELIRKQMFANRVIEHHSGMGGEVLTMAGEVTDIPGVTKAFPGPTPGARLKDRMNPLSDQNVIQRAGSMASYSIEGINRGTAYLNALKKGYDPFEASKVVDRLQVRYENLSEFERAAMKRIAPFYGFTRGVIPWTVKELVERPGGLLSQTAKITARSRDEGLVPEEVSATASINLGGETKAYLSGIGLMEEPVYSLAAPLAKIATGNLMSGASDTWREVLSQTNPALKGIVEIATGKSTYFGGAEPGGRELNTLDPPVGRALENLRVSLLGGEPSQAVRPFGSSLFGDEGSRAIEYAVGASPVSRIVHEIKKAADYRKPGYERAINLLAGPRVVSVTPERESAMAQELVDNALLQLGGRKWTRVSIPDYVKEELSPANQRDVEKISAVQDLLNKIRKDRNKMVK